MADPNLLALATVTACLGISLVAISVAAFKQAQLIKAQGNAITAQRNLIEALELERDAHKANAAAQTEYAEIVGNLAASRLERLNILEGTTHG